jgi:hypothetical protein
VLSVSRFGGIVTPKKKYITMKYLKILVDVRIWHLKPYTIKEKTISGCNISESGFLCFKLIITWK